MFALICKPYVFFDHISGERIIEPTRCKLIQYQCSPKLNEPCIFEIMEAPSPKIKDSLNS